MIMKRNLLVCGLIAGPLFVAASLGQEFTRNGFDLARHPISLLSLGSAGWIQIANFVVSGVLYVLGAVGLRSAFSCSLNSPLAVRTDSTLRSSARRTKRSTRPGPE